MPNRPREDPACQWDITIYRLAGRMLTEFLVQAHRVAMMQQFGAIPVPGRS